MSILKSIMHHWNSTSESYDTLHPETEYAQVTDFGQGTIAHLISSTLAGTVTACSTGSVFGKLVEKLLDASGMKYNFTNSNAWYICLGSLFGGLIIQGGLHTITARTGTITLPLSMSAAICRTLCLSSASGIGSSGGTGTGFNYDYPNYASGTNSTFFWLVFGR